MPWMVHMKLVKTLSLSSRRLSRRRVLRNVALGSLGALYLGSIKADSVNDGNHIPPIGEILILNGLIVDSTHRYKADILIRDGKIQAVGKNLSRFKPTSYVINAEGLQILPGGIDPHVHFGGGFADDFLTGSQAALAGGITTVGQMCFPQQNETLLAMSERYAQVIRAQSLVDVMLHSAIFDSPRLDELGALANAGHNSLKIYMMTEHFNTNLSEYEQALRHAKALGILPMFHCEDYRSINKAQQELQQQGHTSLHYYPESRPVSAEVVATQQAIALCAKTACPIYIVHLSSKEALQLCVQARNKGLPVYVETRPIYLHLTSEQYKQTHGSLYTGMPPLRESSDVKALWEGLANGSIHTLASDHAPWLKAQKLDPEQNIFNVRAGMNNLQVMLPMLYSEGVNKGRLSLERFVAVTSTNAAKLFGLYPQKGAIIEGADADIVLWNPNETRVVNGETGYSNAGFSVFDGTSVTGWPCLSIHRGQPVYRAGQIFGAPGRGRVLSRDAWRDPDFS